MELPAKKSLGQNFLKSQPALDRIISAGTIFPDDIILEVGPGKGALTEKILEKISENNSHSTGKILAVEKDDRLIPLLQEKFSKEISEKKLELLHQDILEFNPQRMLEYGPYFKIVANIPYYITGTFLRKFLSGKIQPERMVVLLQKEVAKRIVAQSQQGEKESLLSISVKAYGTPKYIETVKAKYFSPAPKVDSAILLIEDISKKFFNDLHITPSEHKNKEELFFEIIKAGFAHKRKILIGNLKSLDFIKNKTEKDSEYLEKIFNELSLNKKARAEDLTLSDWKKLIEKI